MLKEFLTTAPVLARPTMMVITFSMSMEAKLELARYCNSTKMVNCALSNTLVEHITSMSVVIVLL